MRLVLLAAAVVLAGGCDRPAPITLPREREETAKPEKESFSGFQTSGTPLPLNEAADPRVADEPSATPSPSVAPEAQAAIQDYTKAMRDLRTDPAVHPPDSLDVIENPSAFQNMNNAIIGHMQAIEDAQDRARAAMNPQQRKAWAAQKKEIDEGGE
jgi:hypothetical protein